MSERVPVVSYAAKSTEDKHESIPGQLKENRSFIEQHEPDGWFLVGEFSDEGFSAYSGNRGDDLLRAKEAAIAAAKEYGRCIFLASDADRFARGCGDKPGAADHLFEVRGQLARQNVEMWTCRLGRELDRMTAFIEGERAYGESERKSHAVKSGLQRRKERGKSVGPVPVGYKVEKTVIDDEVITSRVIDPGTEKVVLRIFDLVESGKTFADVAATLNGEGLRGKNGKPWVRHTVRRIVYNDSYAGANGYDAIIDPDRFDAIHANLVRQDPVQVAKRRSGRKPADESFFLRGIARCSSCGATLYTEHRGTRRYICGGRRRGTGLCSAPPIPAKLIESHVLRHLGAFVGSVEDWLTERVNERQDERREREAACARMRAKLTDLERLRERASDVYREALAEGASTARIALQEVKKIDGELEDQRRRIEEGEAVVSEHTGPPDVDEVLDFYNRLVDHVHGRIEKADGARELNDALSTVVAGLWAEIEEDRERLLVEFELVGEWKHTLPGGVPILPELRRRPMLPPRHLDDRMEPEPLELSRGETGTQTFVRESAGRSG